MSVMEDNFRLAIKATSHPLTSLLSSSTFTHVQPGLDVTLIAVQLSRARLKVHLFWSFHFNQ